MKWIISLITILTFNSPAIALDNFWRFTSYKNLCSISFTDTMYLNSKESILYSVSFGVASLDKDISIRLKEKGVKPLEIVFELLIVPMSSGGGLLGSETLNLPFSLSVGNETLVGQESEDWLYGKDFLINQPISEKLLERILKGDDTKISIWLEGRGKALPLVIDNKNIQLSKALLYECKRFFKKSLN